MERLAGDGQLMAYRHDGFWQCMDTLRDKKFLESTLGVRRGSVGHLGNRVPTGSEAERARLVTGHVATSGRSWCRMLAAGHEVVGLDSVPVRATASSATQSPRSRASGADIRDVTPATSRLRRGHPPGRPLERPARRSEPRLTYEINHHGPRCAWPRRPRQAGVARFLFSSSCSIYGAGGDDLLDERRRVQPGHALRRVEGACRARRSPPWPTTASARRTCATPRPTASRRGSRRPGGEQPGRLRLHDRRGADEERRHSLAAARAHRGHLAGLRRGPRGRPRAWCTTRRSTSGARGELPDPRPGQRSSSRSFRTAASSSPTAPARQAQLPRQLREDRPRAPGREPQWTVRSGVEELYEAYRQVRAHPGGARELAAAAHPWIKQLLEQGSDRTRPALERRVDAGGGRLPRSAVPALRGHEARAFLIWVHAARGCTA